MIQKYKRLVKFLVLAPLLMAFQCEDEGDVIKVNDYSVNITPKTVFALNETIWIEGKVSSKAFNLTTKDSIFNNENKDDTFSVFQFVTPNENTNTKEAIDAFDIILDTGSANFLSSCKNAVVFVNAKLDNTGQFYTYKIGLKPKKKGDYVIDWLDAKLNNKDKNLFIADDYSIKRHPKQIGFNQCGTPSWLYLEDAKNEFLFRVE